MESPLRNVFHLDPPRRIPRSPWFIRDSRPTPDQFYGTQGHAGCCEASPLVSPLPPLIWRNHMANLLFLPCSNLWVPTTRLALGLTCCVIGTIGMCFLWWCQRANYVWLVSSIFVPGWLSGIAGLISTFVGIYGHNNGAYSTLSIATLVVTGASTVICGFLAAFYSFWLLRRLKHEHVRKQRQTGSETGSAGSVFGTGKWAR